MGADKDAFLSGRSASAVGDRVLHVDTTEAATTAVTTLETLWSWVMPAFTLARAGQAIEIVAFGKFGANGNTKNLFLNMGGDAVLARASTGNGTGWVMRARVIRLTSGTYIAQGDAIMATTAFASVPAAASEDFTTDLTLAMKSQNGTASAGDTVFQGVIVRKLT